MSQQTRPDCISFLKSGPKLQFFSAMRVLLAVFIFAQGAIFAAPINFSAPITISADTDVLNLGTKVFAYGFFGATTVNGVSFDLATSAGGTGLTISPSTGTLGTDASFASGGLVDTYTGTYTLAYNKVFQRPYYLDPAVNGTLQTYQFSSLTLGKVYAVQVWIEDSRVSGGNNWTQWRTGILSSTGGNSVAVKYNADHANGGRGQYARGIFVADSTTQTLTNTQGFDASGGITANYSAQINAIQLRDITDSVGIWTGAVNGNWDAATANWSGGINYSSYSSLPSGTPFKFQDTNGSGQTVTSTAVTVQSAGVTVAGSVAFTAGTLNYSLLSAGGTLGINGAGSLYKSGASTLTLAGTHTFTGGVNVAAGTLKTASLRALPNGPVTVSSGATLNLNGYDQSIGLLTQNGTVSSTGGAATLTLGSLAGATAPVFSGSVNLAFSNNAASALTVNASLNPVGTLSNNGTSVSVALGTVTSVATKGATILNGVIGA
ncbi:MAG: Autotransporter-associated beta strand repeat-containing protein, partial [Verrucomicrobia bacterium]